MKKLALTLLAASAMVMGASSASASQFSPAPSGPWTLTGNLTLSQSTTINCDVSFTLNVDAAGNGSITGGSFTAGDSQCGTLVWPQNFAWPVRAVSADTVEISVDVRSILGRCNGKIYATLSGGALDIPAGTTVPGTQIILPFSKNCTVDGYLDVPAGLTIVP